MTEAEQKPKDPKAEKPKLPKLAYSVADILEMVPIGRTLLFDEIRDGFLRKAPIGGRRTIFYEQDVRDWLTRREQGKKK